MAEETEDPLIAALKTHINWEDDMDDSMFPRYIAAAKKYVLNGLGELDEQLVLMVASILADWRVPDKDMESALQALTPFFIQAQYSQVVGDDDATN